MITYTAEFPSNAKKGDINIYAGKGYIYTGIGDSTIVFNWLEINNYNTLNIIRQIYDSEEDGQIDADAIQNPFPDELKLHPDAIDKTALSIKAAEGKISEVIFTGSGPDDMTVGGTYTGHTNRHYIIYIDGTDPDTFRWTPDGGQTWHQYIPITGEPQILEHGIAITFASASGHTLGDSWDFAASAYIGKFLDFKKSDGSTLGSFKQGKDGVYLDGGGFAVTGSTGGTPVRGAGTRLMWIPEKAAFRAGRITDNGWDDENIGYRSVVIGAGRAEKWNDIIIGSGNIRGGYGSNTIIGEGSIYNSSYNLLLGISNVVYDTGAGNLSDNAIVGEYTVISGERGYFHNIFGGYQHRINVNGNDGSTIMGGERCTITESSYAGIIASRISNINYSDYGLIIGGRHNEVNASGAMIIGSSLNNNIPDSLMMGFGIPTIFLADNKIGLGGITDPQSTLDVNGDIEIREPLNGVILKSPGGARWRVTIDNNGELIKTAII